MNRSTLFLALALLVGCQPETAPEATHPLAGLDTLAAASLEQAVAQYRAMDETLPDTLFPRTINPDGTLRTNTSEWWTSGFFPGSLWYLYEFTGNDDLKTRALARTAAVEPESRNASDHDIGFKVYNSFGNALRLTGDTTNIPVLLTAAQTLTTRFDPAVGAIRSWGAHPDTTSPYLVIIDNMMNLELLFWATRHSSDSSYYHLALAHADTTLANHFRPDGSSYHVLEYDPLTGAVLKKRTAQGYADSSSWARGQAWGLYGYTMTYRETGLARYLDQANAIAQFLLNHPDLPEDKVPYWDLNAPDIPDALRDASAAAITASALLELSGFVDEPQRTFYLDNAATMLRTLSTSAYRAVPGTNHNFLLQHGVGHLPADSEVDVPLSYADYYYIEGLLRAREMLADATQ